MKPPGTLDVFKFGGLFIVTFLQLVDGANILFMHHVISYSHRQAMIPLANVLAARGHNITYFSTMRSRGEFVHPTINDIVPPEVEKWSEVKATGTFNIEGRVQGSTPFLFTALDAMVTDCCERQFKSPEFQAWLSVTEKLDLIVVDYYPTCALALAHKLKAKVIEFHTIALWARDVELFSLPHEAGAVHMDCSTWRGCKSPQPFLERVKSALLPLAWRYYEWKTSSVLYRAFEESLNLTREELPSLYDLQQKVALVFLTSNYVTEQAKSLPPMFVNVPGLHLREPKPLPEDIQTFIDSDEDTDGFVYISLGSFVKPQNLPESIQSKILHAIQSFPNLKFFWKWDGSSNDDKFKKVKNLMVKKWFPQQDLLGHPKIRGFVTQAGRPSSQESMYNGVPMITFAVIGDQDYNAQRLEDIGVAIQLEITTVSTDQFRKAIQEIVYNTTYKENAVRQTKLQMDLPMKPMDTAVWWTEYVLRHEDLSHLKPPGSQLSWYQRYWLDVYGFLLVLLVSCISITIQLGRYGLGLVFTRSSAGPQNVENMVRKKTNMMQKRKMG